MEETAQCSEADFQRIYEYSFRTWAAVHLRATKDPSLSARVSYNTDGALQGFPLHRQPVFPPQLNLWVARYGENSKVLASGNSIWRTSDSSKPGCEHIHHSFSQRIEIEVAKKTPVTLEVTYNELTEGSQGADAITPPVPPSSNQCHQNYIAVLALAWAYVLSARWAELMPGLGTVVYTNCQVTCRVKSLVAASSVSEDAQGTFPIDVGDVSPEEARWWSAILAQGQGWLATLTLCTGGHSEDTTDTFMSPWAVNLQSFPKFMVSVGSTSATEVSFSTAPALSFAEARRCLDAFCERHNVMEQSLAALAAALLIPSMSMGRALELPGPRSGVWRPRRPDSRDGGRGLDLGSNRRPPCHKWLDHELALEKLLTLGCFGRGIRAMLLNAFFEPTIECNQVTPWLQGALGAIDFLAGGDPLVVCRMLMDRAPEASILWLGATVLGLQKRLLREARSGMIPIELHTAEWSGTVQSFLQEPLPSPLRQANGSISRADECRILFLAQAELHTRDPICPWRPFGRTA